MENLTLTSTDHAVLNSYKNMLDGLSAYLGPGYEIVLHSLEDMDHSAIKVINGHFTGRSEGAPITDLAISLLEQIKASGDIHKAPVYFNKSRNGKPLRSTTLPILGENDRIIGLLCMNFHTEVSLSTLLEGFYQVSSPQTSVTETFVSNADDVIRKAVENARIQVLNDPAVPTSNKNKEIISLLHEKDIFKLKGAVPKVAEQLGISVNTVYLHLRNL